MAEVGRHNPEELEKARMNIAKFTHQQSNDDRRFGLDTQKTAAYLANMKSQEAYRNAQLKAAAGKNAGKMSELDKLLLKDQLEINQLTKKKELGLLPGQNRKGKGGKSHDCC